MPGEEPSKRESHTGSPRLETRRARISVTASMSSAGSIAAGKGERGSVKRRPGLFWFLQGQPPTQESCRSAQKHSENGPLVSWWGPEGIQPHIHSSCLGPHLPRGFRGIAALLPAAGGCSAQPCRPLHRCSYFTCHCNSWTEVPESLQRQRCPATEAPRSWRAAPQRQGELGQDRQTGGTCRERRVG